MEKGISDKDFIDVDYDEVSSDYLFEDEDEDEDIIMPSDIVEDNDISDLEYMYSMSNRNEDVEEKMQFIIDATEEVDVSIMMGSKQLIKGDQQSLIEENKQITNYLMDNDLIIEDDDDGEFIIPSESTGLSVAKEITLDNGLVIRDVSVITSLTTYSREDEATLIIDKADREQHLLNVVNKTDSPVVSVIAELQDYLNSDDCKDIPSRHIQFMSEKYNKRQNFQTAIVNGFVNTFQESGSLADLDYSHVIDELKDIVKVEELKMSDIEIELMVNSVHKFAKVFKVKLNTYFSKTISKETIIEAMGVIPPSLVRSDHYVCQCGNICYLPSHVPLTMAIFKLQSRLDYILLNPAVPCSNCKSILAIPEIIITEIESALKDSIISESTVKIETVAYYRPKIERFEKIIPTNLRYLFDLNEIVVVEDTLSIYQNISFDKYVSQYRILVEFLIQNKRKDEAELNKSNSTLSLFNCEGFNRTSGDKIIDIFDSIDLKINVKSEYNMFVQNVIYFLESLGCFALTYRSRAKYKYLDTIKSNTQSFDTQEAIDWMLENAWALAGIKSITSNTKITNVDLYEEYIPTINYIFMLRCLSSESITSGSIYKSWQVNPATQTVGKVMQSKKKSFAISAIDNLTSSKSTSYKELAMVALSKRDIKNVGGSITRRTFDDLYSLSKFLSEAKIASPERFRFKDQFVLDLIEEYEQSNDTSEEFYNNRGIDVQDLLVDKDTLCFDDFKRLFFDSGHLIFETPISEPMITASAKCINLLALTMRHDILLRSFVKSENYNSNISHLMKVKEVDKEKEKLEFRNAILLFDTSLNLIDETIVEFMDEETLLKTLLEIVYSDENNENELLSERYPGVFYG